MLCLRPCTYCFIFFWSQLPSPLFSDVDTFTFFVNGCFASESLFYKSMIWHDRYKYEQFIRPLFDQRPKDVDSRCDTWQVASCNKSNTGTLANIPVAAATRNGVARRKIDIYGAQWELDGATSKLARADLRIFKYRRTRHYPKGLDAT